MEFLRPEKDDSWAFIADEDAKAIGPSNRSIELLRRCIAMLEYGQNTEQAQRLLKRYTEVDYGTAAEWRKWLAEFEARLFFSDVGGFKFFVGPAPKIAEPVSKTIDEQLPSR